MEKSLFGKTSAGEEVSKYILTNASGAQIELIDYGAIILSVKVPDKNGILKDVVLGYDDIAAYEVNPSYMGAVLGRVANRVENASFTIDDVTYQMFANENKNALHSGPNGYEKRLWDATDAGEDYVTFSLVSPDGDQGCPGEFRISVTYTFTDDNQIQIHYDGICDKDTVVNLTNHSYFNLSGHESGSIENHILVIYADNFTPASSSSVPTGEIVPVAGTPMDFTVEKEIGRDIGNDYEQLKFAGGYDHNYVLNDQNTGVRLIAKAASPVTGIGMEVYSDTVGVQFYAGNFINGPVGKGGAVYDVRHGFCLETQHYPNAANIPHFPSPILKKGEKYDTTTIYKFI